MANGFKSGGRKAGTPNKTTGQIKEILTDIVSRELETLEQTLLHLTPAERLQFLIKLIGFVMPKPIPQHELPNKDIEVTLNLNRDSDLRPLNKLDLLLTQTDPDRG